MTNEQKHIDPALVGPIPEADVPFIDTAAPCDLWHKALDGAGYGLIFWKGKLERVHRVAYALSRGLPMSALKGKKILHICDNPRCLQFRHLIADTQARNIADRVRRGRSAVGERHARSVLTDELVRAIRTMHRAGSRKFGPKALALHFGFPKPTIKGVLYRKTWMPVT